MSFITLQSQAVHMTCIFLLQFYNVFKADFLRFAHKSCFSQPSTTIAKKVKMMKQKQEQKCERKDPSPDRHPCESYIFFYKCAISVLQFILDLGAFNHISQSSSMHSYYHMTYTDLVVCVIT